MEVEIEKIGATEKEQLIIRCHRVTEEVRDIAAFARARQGWLAGTKDNGRYEIPYGEICYFESVDGRTFLYTIDAVYETAYRIYELEEMLRGKYFLRTSKAMLVNLVKIQSIHPALNGRFSATMTTGEEVIISRKYVKAFKTALNGYANGGGETI